MKGIWKWILFGGIVFVVALLIALPLFGGGWMMPARSWQGFGMMNRGMMGFGWGSFGLLGLLFRIGLPLLVVIGLAALVYFLVRRPPAATGPQTPAAMVPCGKCGKPLDPAWVACPYCGKKQ
jgi:hypothetical protein